MVGFGTAAIDIDQDSQYEILTTNGHVDFGAETSVAQPFHAFRINHDGFAEWLPASSFGEYGQRPHIGRALAITDVNRDYFMDVVVTHLDEPVALLVNHSENQNHSLELELIGRSSSRDAVGAVLSVKTDAESFDIPIVSGGSYMSSSRRRVSIALGKSKRLEQLRVLCLPATRNISKVYNPAILM